MKKQTTKGAPTPAATTPPPEIAAIPPGGWPRDEFSGRAGRYVRDPVTGLRRPAGEAATEQPTTEA
ncbi:hypothetical protein [Hydrogenophaga sp.]|uniref:hypothetical protein n=1 Tax=Hydrogenophaga sp. TaxID=1904254 RepID=UPI003D109C71